MTHSAFPNIKDLKITAASFHLFWINVKAQSLSVFVCRPFEMPIFTKLAMHYLTICKSKFYFCYFWLIHSSIQSLKELNVNGFQNIYVETSVCQWIPIVPVEMNKLRLLSRFYIEDNNLVIVEYGLLSEGTPVFI